MTSSDLPEPASATAAATERQMPSSKLASLILIFGLVGCDTTTADKAAFEAESAFARQMEATRQSLLERSRGCERVQQRTKLFRRLRDTITECLDDTNAPAFAMQVDVILHGGGLALQALRGASPLLMSEVVQACVHQPVQQLKLDDLALLDDVGPDDLWPSYELELARDPARPLEVVERTACSPRHAPSDAPEIAALGEVRDQPHVLGSPASDDRVTRDLLACERGLDADSWTTARVFPIELRGVSGQAPSAHRCSPGPEDALSTLRTCFCEAFRDHLPDTAPSPVTLEAVTSDGRNVRSSRTQKTNPVVQRWWLVRDPSSPARYYSIRRLSE